MPGRTRQEARVSKLYKLKMQGRYTESPQEEEKKVEPKKEEDNSE